MARVLITGGRGLLGRELVARMSDEMFSETLAYTTYRQAPEPAAPGEPIALDLLDGEAAQRAFDRWRPEIVVHTAAPRGNDALPAIARTTEHVAKAATAVGSRLIHLSSDMVFDGLAPPYDESAVPRPVSAYGEAKLAAEEAVTASDCESLVVRTSLIYGFDPIDHQTAWIVGALECGDPITLFDDEYRNPVYVRDLAASIAELAASSVVGVIHVAGAQSLSRWQIGSRILAHLGLDPSDVVTPGRLAASGLRRPPNLTLDLTRARAFLDSVPRGLDAVLAAEPSPTVGSV